MDIIATPIELNEEEQQEEETIEKIEKGEEQKINYPFKC